MGVWGGVACCWLFGCQNVEVTQPVSRQPSDVLKDVEVGVRGHNKVTALAKDLADKFSAEKKPPPPPAAQEPRPVSINCQC